MDAAAVNYPNPRASALLLQHVGALGGDASRRPPAAARLEAVLGRELAGRLVAALVVRKPD